MKKLLTAFVTAALLMVCMCVPAFAVDECSCDIFDLYVDYISTNIEERYSTFSARQVCRHCKSVLDSVSFDVIFEQRFDVPLVTSDDGLIYIMDSDGISFDDLMSAYQWFSNMEESHPVTLIDDFYYFVYDSKLIFINQVFTPQFFPPHFVPFGSLGYTQQNVDYINQSYGTSFTLESSAAEVGLTLLDRASKLDYVNPPILFSVTSFVSSAVDWISAFALCIISNPLFLIFVCCIFVGLGIGLIKRIIRL